MEIEDSLKEKLETLSKDYENSLPGLLGIELLSASQGAISAKMPVDSRSKQPFGILHGGASVALAETLASIGGWLAVENQTVVGLEINANHVRPVREGFVIGEAKALHLGRSTQVWEIRITDEAQRLVCISRCTLAVLPKE